MKICAVISPHGFGHASRAVAVLEALYQKLPNLQIDIFTSVPEWFFRDSFKEENFRYFYFETDIGVVQQNPLQEDLPGTIERLKSFIPFGEEKVKYLVKLFKQNDYQLVLCDISPLGISAAKQAEIPAVLIENFTWDWIYAGYLNLEPRFLPFIEPLRDIFLQADYHIQTEPVCEYMQADLITSPVSRQPRTPREQMRELLKIGLFQSVVLITMGGIPQAVEQLQPLRRFPDVVFVIPGASESYERRGNLILLPHHHSYYHPDLVHTSDVVVGKLGYSTIAEAYHAGVPYIYIPRDHFRETQPLASFVERELGGVRIEQDAFFSNKWLDVLPQMLSKPRKSGRRANGAQQIAEFISERLGLWLFHPTN